MAEALTAAAVRAELGAEASADEGAKIRNRMTDERTEVIGVRMATVFAIAKKNERMPLPEVDRMLDSDAYEMRMVAVSILEFRARRKGVDRSPLYELWMRRLDRIDTWDLIDRSAPRVVGWYRVDRRRRRLGRTPSRRFGRVAHPSPSARRFRGVSSVLRCAPVLRHSTVTALHTPDVPVGKERRDRRACEPVEEDLPCRRAHSSGTRPIHRIE